VLKDIKDVELNESQTDFEGNTPSNFTGSSAYGMYIDRFKQLNDGKVRFTVFKSTSIPNKPVKIYKFKYNYLCSGKVLEYNSPINDTILMNNLISNTGNETAIRTFDVSYDNSLIKHDFWISNSSTEKDIGTSIIDKLNEALIKLNNNPDNDKKISQLKIDKEESNKNIEERKKTMSNFYNTVSFNGETSKNPIIGLDNGKFFNYKPGYKLTVKDRYVSKFIGKTSNSLPIVNYIKNKAENATGVNGWRLVRFLPPNSGKWYSINDNLTGTIQYGTPYNTSNEWSIPFDDFDEFCFSTLNFKHWLYCTKDAVNGTTYGTAQRPIIRSSTSPTTAYNAIWLNRAQGAPEDPWISLGDHAKDILYGENSYPPVHPGSHAMITNNGGMCVWVRSSRYRQTEIQPITINADFKYVSFVNTGDNQTQYTITFSENTECDILIVGGGGAGGKTDAGGGGAGGLVYDTGLFLNGTYNILVGKGGDINNTGGNVGLVGQNGTNSKISNTSSFNKEAVGGGGGGSGFPNDIESSTIGGSSGGLGTSDKIRNIGFTAGQGNKGGLGALANRAADAGAGDGGGGGGGGAGGSGFDSPNGTGGIGRQIIITGTNTYYAGGGGGGHGNNSSGGLGGGGEGRAGGKGLNATFFGGGGGGGGGGYGDGGSGFAGIVIIRFRSSISDNVLIERSSENIDNIEPFSNFKNITNFNEDDNTKTNVIWNNEKITKIEAYKLKEVVITSFIFLEKNRKYNVNINLGIAPNSIIYLKTFFEIAHHDIKTISETANVFKFTNTGQSMFLMFSYTCVILLRKDENINFTIYDNEVPLYDYLYGGSNIFTYFDNVNKGLIDNVFREVLLKNNTHLTLLPITNYLNYIYDYWKITKIENDIQDKINIQVDNDNSNNKRNSSNNDSYQKVIKSISERNFSNSGLFNTLNPSLNRLISPTTIFENCNESNESNYITYEKDDYNKKTPTINVDSENVGSDFTTNFNIANDSKRSIYVLRV